MQVITVDLKKSPDVASLVADLEPGAKLVLHGSIKAKDEQTLKVTLEEVEEGEASEAEDMEEEDMEEEEGDAEV